MKDRNRIKELKRQMDDKVEAYEVLQDEVIDLVKRILSKENKAVVVGHYVDPFNTIYLSIQLDHLSYEEALKMYKEVLEQEDAIYQELEVHFKPTFYYGNEEVIYK